MAGGSGYAVFTAIGGNQYTFNTYYTVSWTANSQNRTSSPASGSDWGGTVYNCGSNITWTINCSERLGGVGSPYNYFSFTINGSTPACPTYPPSWSDNTLGGFQVGTAYSDAVAATNMSYSGTYSVSSGSLPGGISLNSSTGAVTGTPTVAGAYSFTITASNSYGSINSSFSGTVAAAPAYPPTWTDNSLAAFVVGQTYSDSVAATDMSYSGVFSVSSGSLPAGISLNTGTGAVTGTPTSNVNYAFTLTATNTYGSVNQAFSGTVGGGLSVYDGTSWYKGPVKVYNGSTWDVATVKTYNGSTWEVTK